MKSIIGIGSIGFDALRYFGNNFSNIPEYTLFLSDKNFEDKYKKLKAYSEIITDDNLFKMDKGNLNFSIHLKDRIKEFSKDKEVYILNGLAGSFSGYISIKIAEFIIENANKVFCIGVLPFNFEGFKKKDSANINSSLLKKLGVEVIELDNQGLFKKINNKTTMSEASEIHFREMAKYLGI